ncbi:MAG: helix-turn-helix domain-containing protein [Bacteriovorax sp.]|nr:helix-turn-helix domain-containing protein [Bacteriovorax sp.]
MEHDHTLEILRRLGKIIDDLNKQTFSLEEAAAFLKTTTETVEYYSKRQKQLSHVNLGGTLVFRRKDLEEFMEKKLKKGFVF